MGCGGAFYLIIAFEDVVELVGIYVCATVIDAHTQLFVCRLLHLHLYLPAVGSVLESIGEQVTHYFLKLVMVHPHIKVLLIAASLYFYASKTRGLSTYRCEGVELAHRIIFGHTQAQGIGLKLVEIEHLVYEHQHAVHAHTHRVERLAHRARQRLVALEHDQRTGNKG